MDHAKSEVQERLLKALAELPDAELAWNRLPPSQQREHLAYIEEVKKAETQERRVQKTVQALLQKR